MANPTRPPDRPPEPMSESARLLYLNRHAVRVGMPGQTGHCAQTIQSTIVSARYAALPVPPDVDAALVVVSRWAESVRVLVDRESAERARTGISPAEHQRAVESAHVQAAIARGKHATGQRP